MQFNICVPIPVKSGDFKETKELIKRALETKPDFIEFRFDYINNSKALNTEHAKKILNLVPPAVPAIFTFRDPSEGGQTKIDDPNRLNILKALIQAKPRYFDIEMRSNKQILEQIIALAKQNNVQLIFSYHDFQKTPVYEEGLKIFRDFLKELNKKEKNNFIDSCIFKTIFTAQKFEDNLTALKICKTISESDCNVICFCMGELGIFSRLMCVRLGLFSSFLTFGSFEEQTAPGQLHINKMREIYQLLFKEEIKFDEED